MPATPVADLSPEAELLLDAAQARLGASNGTRRRTSAREGIDWTALLRLARRHALMPLLHRHLLETPLAVVPDAIRDELKSAFHEHTLRNLFLSGELLKLLALFESHGIRAIPYKGPILAVHLHGNLALRQFEDLDFLLRTEDVGKARDLLAARGYRLWLPLTHDQESAQLRSFCVLAMEREDGILVELHTEIVPRGFSCRLDVRPFWTRLKPVALGDREVWTFSPEDLLLILCVHGAKHCWISLGWIGDVAGLLAVHPDMNWGQVREQAHAARGERMLDLGLQLARSLLDAPLPADVEARIQNDASVTRLARRVRQRLFLEKPSRLPNNLESVFFHLRARECPWDGARYGLSLLLTPTPADWEALPLPPTLSFLYYLLRPIRLAGKYVRQVTGKSPS